MVEIIDDGSANGIVIGDAVVDRAVLRPGTVVVLGDTTLSVTLHDVAAASNDATGAVAFNRSPRLDPQYAGIELKAPEPPKPAQRQRFPIVTLVAPIMMAGMIYAITRNPMSILFVALSPLMMIGGWFENRTANNKALEQATAHFRSSLVDLAVQLQYAADLEREGRRREHPSAGEIEVAVRDLTPLTWTRRPEHEAFLRFRLGLGTQPSRNSVEMPTTRDTVPELWRELTDVVGQFSTIDRVPVVADFRVVGNVGVAGPHTRSAPLMANVVGQMRRSTHPPSWSSPRSPVKLR
jgi:DNA segregation ATPase FtsK/SpoIIIE, S-DNA-T family